jgi:hypothetical protein
MDTGDELMEDAEELEYLRWFVGHCDFGPADEDVRDSLAEAFEKEYKKRVPKYWRNEDGPF